MSADIWLCELHRNFAKTNLKALSPGRLRAEEHYLDPTDTDRLFGIFRSLVQQERGIKAEDWVDYRMRVRKHGSTVWGWFGVDGSGNPLVAR